MGLRDQAIGDFGATPGSEILSSTAMPNPPGILPIPTAESIEASAGTAILSRPPTNFSAPTKQAA